jgi:PKD repeat protein
VLSPVIAKFSMPSSATHDELVAVDASASSSSDGSSVAGYAWDWGDGSAPATGGPTNSHTFATAGVYTVSLIATSANGAKSVASTAKIAVDVQAPTTGGQPAISGTTTNLNTLTAVHAAWTGSPTDYAYQWRRCAANGTGCSDIPGATGPSHRLLDADVGHTLVVVETASNAVGPGTGVTSAPTAVIAAAAPPSTSLFYAAAASPFTTAPHPTDVAVNPASTLLAVTNGNDNTVSEFSIGSGGSLTPVAGSPFATGGLNPTTLAYSPDGKWLAVGNSSASGGNVSTQTLTMFAVGAQGALTQAPGSPRASTPTSSSPSGLAFSPDGKLLATADGSPTTHAIRVYSVGSDGSVAQAPGSPLRASAVPLTVAFSPSSGLLVSALPQVNKIQEFAIAADGKPSALGSPVAVGQLPLAAVYSPGGSMLAVANANDLTYGSLSTFSVGDSGGLTATAGSPAYTIPVYNPVDLAWGPTGLLAIAGDAGEGGVYTVSPAGELTQLPQMPYEVGNHAGGDERPAIAFSGNGGLLAGIDPLHGGLRVLLQSVGTRRLTITVSGPGHVLSVPSENAGVDCTSSCTYDFPTGKTVHLYESGSDPQQFLGWSGDCSGLGGDCNLAMTSDRTITATFKPAPTPSPTPTPSPSPSPTPVPTSAPVITSPTTTTPPTTTESSGVAAPNTQIKRLKVTAKKGTASLTFAGTGGVGKLKFLCKLDKGRAVPCGSPKTFKHLKRGKHTLTVTAVDSRGRKDASPAKKTFKV